MADRQTILSPVDFSNSALLAVREAAALSRALKARLVLLHVVDLVLPAGLGFTSFEPTTLVLEHERIMRERLRRLADELRSEEIDSLQELTVAGPAHALIVQVAEQRGADLIVMGRGARKGLQRLLGSVADRVVRQASCPVMVFPEPANDFDLD